MRIILTGSRTWTDVETIERHLLPLLLEHPDAVLVEGGALGADTIGTNLWVAAGGKTDPFHVKPRDWYQPCREDCDHGPRPRRRDGTSYCPSPGPRRNQAMADSGGDLCIAFRMPGKSNGTDDMIERARKAGIPVRVVRPGEQDALF